MDDVIFLRYSYLVCLYCGFHVIYLNSFSRYKNSTGVSCGTFIYRATSMENILQSIVKIIIIGSLCTNENVYGYPQYLPPPLPYYQNDGYFLPGFVPPHHDPLPVFYQEQNLPPPISYQNMNSYTPPQLFHQNENYHPPQFSNPNPNVGYNMPQIIQYELNPPQPYNLIPKNDFHTPQVSYKQLHVKPPQKKPGFYMTNILIGNEGETPLYQDEIKNSHEDDYADNYSDEVPPSPEPCLSNFPYQYFESHTESSKSPNLDKYTLCNPHFQPNLGSNVYTVKMPITLLPSRFPPRVEQLIERIQNYFSTYTQQEIPKPQNESSPATPVQTVTEATTTTEANTILTTVTDQNKKNTTTEIEELGLEETNSEPTEVPTVTAVIDSESGQVPQKTIVVEIQASDEDGQLQKSQAFTQIPTVVTKTPMSSTEALVPNQREMETEGTTPKEVSTTQLQVQESSAPIEKLLENQISNELVHSENIPSQMMEVKSTASVDTEMSNKPEETATNETLLEVTDKNG